MSFRYFEEAAHAVVYNKFRPTPPAELIERIIRHVKEQLPIPLYEALDVGCGSGQSTEVLSPYFCKVTGSDPSEKQITEAQKKNKLENVTYKVGSAEVIDCPDTSVQLVTASQSCHWFDLPKFYAEAERILVPGGVLAMYGYLLPKPQFGKKSKELCDIVDKYYNITLGKYVLPESKKVYLEHYRGEDFNNVPFISGPIVRDESISVEKNGTVADLVGYISSWSAFQNYAKQEGEEKASVILQQLEKEVMNIIGSHMNSNETRMTIKYKYFLLMARKPL